MFFAYRLNVRKIFPLHLPFTLDIASLYNHRTNFERLPKYKHLIPYQNPEKYPTQPLPNPPNLPSLPILLSPPHLSHNRPHIPSSMHSLALARTPTCLTSRSLPSPRSLPILPSPINNFILFLLLITNYLLVLQKYLKHHTKNEYCYR